MNLIHRTAAIAVTSGVAVASLVLPTAAVASTTTDPAAAAAKFLTRQLQGKHHDHYTGSYESGGKTVTYVNYGETADAILSMDAAGVAQTAAARATAYLEKNVGSYAGTSSDNYSPGAIGKLMLVAEAQHISVANFGGLNLRKAVASTEGARGAAEGEYQQNPAGTPDAYLYFSTVSQALPVLALASAPSTSGQPDAAAVSFLASQQCSDGGYPSQLMTDASAACAAGEDVDSTAYAAQALLATNSDAAAKSIKWLVSKQHSNGSFGTPGNANSTAIAIEALVAGHKTGAKANALKWLESRQLGCSAKATGRGAVAYASKQTALDAAHLPTTLLATSQAGVALAGLALNQADNHGAKNAAPTLQC